MLWNVWFQAEAWISHTTSPTPPSYEVGGIAKRIKTARLRRKTNLQKSDYPKALCVLECDDLYLCQIINTQCVILIIGGREISRPYHTKSFGRFDTTSLQEIMLSSRFFAVKWRAVFILGAKWIALVRGWRRDCVVGGMETRFQWRKAHSRIAKCEAFHIAPRLFFYVFVFESIDDSATMKNLSISLCKSFLGDRKSVV